MRYNKKIVIIWDKDHCPEFPKKEQIPEDISSILSIKAINWSSELYIRDAIIGEILKNMNLKPMHLMLKYEQFNEWHEFLININISSENNIVTGYGRDIVGSFIIEGYLLKNRLVFDKSYNTHNVFYNINILNKIGTWEINEINRGRVIVIEN